MNAIWGQLLPRETRGRLHELIHVYCTPLLLASHAIMIYNPFATVFEGRLEQWYHLTVSSR
jgi:hypothetical protein